MIIYLSSSLYWKFIISYSKDISHHRNVCSWPHGISRRIGAVSQGLSFGLGYGLPRCPWIYCQRISPSPSICYLMSSLYGIPRWWSQYLRHLLSLSPTSTLRERNCLRCASAFRFSLWMFWGKSSHLDPHHQTLNQGLHHWIFWSSSFSPCLRVFLRIDPFSEEDLSWSNLPYLPSSPFIPFLSTFSSPLHAYHVPPWQAFWWSRRAYQSYEQH